MPDQDSKRSYIPYPSNLVAAVSVLCVDVAISRKLPLSISIMAKISGSRHRTAGTVLAINIDRDRG